MAFLLAVYSYMAKLNNQYPHTAFFGIGIMQAKTPENIGTLWRSAYVMGASFIFTVDKRYKKQSSDVVTAPSRIPLYHYENIEDVKKHLPHGAPLVGVELCESAVFVHEFEHPRRAVYLLGSENNGLPPTVLQHCHHVIKLPGAYSLNVSVAGSIIMHDRIVKIPHVLPQRV